MSENWRVMPDGGGDFSDTETAKNAKNGDCTGRGIINFDLHDGTNDLQEWTIDGFTNQDAANHPTFVVSKAERHDRTKASGGAWINRDDVSPGIVNDEEYVEIVGVRGVMDHIMGGPFFISANKSNVIVDSCLVVAYEGYPLGFCIRVSSTVVSIDDIIIRNNIIYCAGFASGIDASASGIIEDAEMTIVLRNNAIDGAGDVGMRMLESDLGYAATLNGIIENNIVTNSLLGDFDLTVVLGTIIGNNNCSEDSTAGALPGSGNIFYQNPADLFVGEGIDLGLKEGSNALNAGKTIITFDWDAVHVDGDNWRPQGDAWDMGAIEMPAAGIARPKVGATLADGLAGGRLAA